MGEDDMDEGSGVQVTDDGDDDGGGGGGWCSDKLFDSSVSWNTTHPDISVCLQKTVLVWAPCGLLWLLFLPRVWLLSRKCKGTISHSALNVTRTVLTLGLAVLAVIDIAFWSSSEFLVDILDPIIRLLTWLLVVVIIQASLHQYKQIP